MIKIYGKLEYHFHITMFILDLEEMCCIWKETVSHKALQQLIKTDHEDQRIRLTSSQPMGQSSL